jgi:hypothetical protein
LPRTATGFTPLVYSVDAMSDWETKQAERWVALALAHKRNIESIQRWLLFSCLDGTLSCTVYTWCLFSQHLLNFQVLGVL